MNYISVIQNGNKMQTHTFDHAIVDNLYKTRKEPIIDWSVPREQFFYCLCMFPYPSGQLHMGHVRNYTLGDVVSRYMRMNSYQVFHPIGWDAFGLPAENAAIKRNTHPSTWTEKNIQNMKEQLKNLSIDYNWSHELQTNDPDYYKWQQLLFIKMYHKGLAERKKAFVNWDPIDKTVLANEQVVNGKGWRSGAHVEQIEITQWFLKITEYKEQLLEGLNELSGKWPAAVLNMQKNWIGKSHGHEVNFGDIVIYTTRLDTIMGAVAILLSHDHTITKELAKKDPELDKFIKNVQMGSICEANLETTEKQGYKTALTVTHPITGQTLDVWVANYVLVQYGSGAIMCVPAHCPRDREFAENYNIAYNEVIADNKLISSGKYTGLTSDEAIYAITKDHPNIREKTCYRLRDWGISRQRYWGCPIPIIHCPNCGILTVPEDELPVVLPTNIEFKKDGKTLISNSDFCNTTCHKCQGPAQRETDTFDTFFDSSWYFARFLDPKANSIISRTEFLPVDLYIGGIEHAIMHLLYARFISYVMYDLGLTHNKEPFKALLSQGMVLNKGQKMSKSKLNVISPDEMLEKYGSDSVRLFMMFASPCDQSLEWSENGLEGMHRFCSRLVKIANQLHNILPKKDINCDLYINSQQFIKNIIHDYENHNFNTIVSECMKWANLLQNSIQANNLDIIKDLFESMLKCIAPIIPGLSNYIWQNIFKYENTLDKEKMPICDNVALSKKNVTWIIQINGKKRESIETKPGLSESEIYEIAINIPVVNTIINDATIKKTIIVPNRLINLVL